MPRKKKEEVKKEEIKKEVEKEVSEEIEKPGQSQAQNSQLKWIFLIMGVLILFVIIGAWISYESKKTDYIGMTFTKEMFGDIPLYSTQITGYNAVTGQPIKFKFVLRNNPRESKVPVNGTIEIRGGPVYFSMNMTDDNLNRCGDSYVLVGLGQFATNIGINMVTAINPKEKALEFNRTFADCTNMPNSTVIIFTEGNQTRIDREYVNPNCYKISVSGCDSLAAIERFEVGVLAKINDKQL